MKVIKACDSKKIYFEVLRSALHSMYRSTRSLYRSYLVLRLHSEKTLALTLSSNCSKNAPHLSIHFTDPATDPWYLRENMGRRERDRVRRV